MIRIPNNFKMMAAPLLCLGTILALVPSIADAGDFPEGYQYKHSYPDVPATHRFYEDIMMLSEDNAFGASTAPLSGFEDGSFRPQQLLTRGQAATMMMRAGKLPFAYTPPKFSDVSKKSKIWQYIATAEKNGIISGYPDGTFRPDQLITRAEMAIIMNRLFKLDSDPKLPDVNKWADRYAARHGKDPAALQQPFTDVPPHAKSYAAVLNLRAFDISSGYPGNLFRPSQNVSRGETAALLRRGLVNAMTITESNYQEMYLGDWGQLLSKKLFNHEECSALTIPEHPETGDPAAGSQTKYRYYANRLTTLNEKDKLCHGVYAYFQKETPASEPEIAVSLEEQQPDGTYKDRLLAAGSDVTKDKYLTFKAKDKKSQVSNSFYDIYGMEHTVYVPAVKQDRWSFVYQVADVWLSKESGGTAYPSLVNNSERTDDFNGTIAVRYDKGKHKIIIHQAQQQLDDPHRVIPEEIQEVPADRPSVATSYWNAEEKFAVTVEIRFHFVE